MIVVSILLAFWIDAWWVGLGEAEDERESLELVSRDLRAAIVQLTEYAEFAEQVGTRGLDAVAALSSGDPQDSLQLSRMIQQATDRKTVALPAAAYTDLVSTGNLRLIQNRKLRDAIVRYYESAEIAQRILEKNSALFLDEHIYSFYGDGLVMWRTDVPWGHREAQLVAMQDAASQEANEAYYKHGNNEQRHYTILHFTEPEELWDDQVAQNQRPIELRIRSGLFLVFADRLCGMASPAEQPVGGCRDALHGSGIRSRNHRGCPSPGRRGPEGVGSLLSCALHQEVAAAYGHKIDG